MPRPVIEVDHFEETRAVIDLIDRAGVSELINVAGPTTVHVFFEGSNEGDAQDDDGDGFDEVQTEMVSMSCVEIVRWVLSSCALTQAFLPEVRLRRMKTP